MKAKAALEGTNKFSTEFKLSSVLQLILGRRYGFQDWIDQSAPIVVRTPLSQLTDEELELLGSRTIHHLIGLNHRLTRHCQRIAVALPQQLSIHATDCKNRGLCAESWRQTCDRLMTAMFLSDHLSEKSIIRLLRDKENETASMRSMSIGCMDRVVRIAERGLTGRDDELIEQTVQDISKL